MRITLLLIGVSCPSERYYLPVRYSTLLELILASYVNASPYRFYIRIFQKKNLLNILGRLKKIDKDLACSRAVNLDT